MDPIQNPFSPGAGSRPPELVGRDDVLTQARILFSRVKQGKPEKSMLLTGLRGVGKTVLLNEIEHIGKGLDYSTIFIEAVEDKPLGMLIAPHLRSLLYELDRLSGAGHQVKRGLAVLKSFVSTIKITYGDMSLGLDIDPEKGSADSGNIELDLTAIFLAVAEAAKAKQRTVAILIDEIQYFNYKELGALIMAMHKMQQKQLPLTLIGAGLPILPGLAGDSKSYAERLFGFPDIGALSPKDASKALQDPAQAEGVSFTQSALDEIYTLTHGYPYFLQEWGYQTWNLATASPIDLTTVQQATADVITRLDKNFFKVRFDRLSPSEKLFLRAMASLGPGPYRISDIANKMEVKVTSLGPRRSKLIRKGMIYSPGHGDLAFTVPLFDEFMKRAIPLP